MKKFIGLLVSAVAVIGLSSCGGDDGGIGAGTASGDAKKVADALVSSAAESDVTIDEACVSDVVDKLSEADLTLVVDNLDGLLDGTVDEATLDISEEGITTLQSLGDCLVGS